MMDNFSQRRNGKLQRSQDSGALTDWSNPRDSPTHSGEEDGEPPPPPPPPKFVTVLAVNGGLSEPPPPPAPAMTMEAPDYVGGGVVCLSSSGFVEEVACVARRPGEKLGFGLKFDGGTETDRPVQRLFIQCCAESSPAAQVRCSWGRLVEADQIVQIDGDDIRTLTRLQVSLSNSSKSCWSPFLMGLGFSLKIRIGLKSCFGEHIPLVPGHVTFCFFFLETE